MPQWRVSRRQLQIADLHATRAASRKHLQSYLYHQHQHQRRQRHKRQHRGRRRGHSRGHRRGHDKSFAPSCDDRKLISFVVSISFASHLQITHRRALAVWLGRKTLLELRRLPLGAAAVATTSSKQRATSNEPRPLQMVCLRARFSHSHSRRGKLEFEFNFELKLQTRKTIACYAGVQVNSHKSNLIQVNSI